MNTPAQHILRSIGIIMDGNRRWAKGRGLPAAYGHKSGYETLKEITVTARDAGVQFVTAYAFSTENWMRSKMEVALLIKLLRTVLATELPDLKQEKIAVRFIGQLERFPKSIQEDMARFEKETKDGARITLVIALSYGGRAEIFDAVRQALRAGIAPKDEDALAKFLWTAGVPDPDLIIRTGGEERLSNFLLWQAAYSELFFTKTLWPDFSKREFRAMLRAYAGRERRRGA
ncbi:MAG: di-trans,poly-cis-decaprenylcistransferase [Candidatus Yonathbacteria bacterium RIFCSPHIGHO2_01_FULL_51_10]|uniref:Isoprenyl transferase n=1 Tax=Candidatus Yonathbacteria bacterium RIFCSPHIGHO2_01_FULL_51_10 TaxID=1802723 RepID=A0A1G2S3R5_9BACT|nr:MAG: di-trans,poly-cis-decaprenylcistransferase [Candidatus Yonathbacteria bacterium RIFCSPHIGHO2_01_FULL_51_10]